MFIFEREREREKGGAAREGDTESEAGSRLCAVSTKPNVGLEPMKRKRQPLDFGSGHDLTGLRSSPASGSILSMQSAWDSPLPFPSLPFPSLPFPSLLSCLLVCFLSFKGKKVEDATKSN